MTSDRQGIVPTLTVVNNHRIMRATASLTPHHHGLMAVGLVNNRGPNVGAPAIEAMAFPHSLILRRLKCEDPCEAR